MISSSLEHEIISSIRNGIDDLKAFVDILIKEEHALIEGKISELETFGLIKSKLVDRLTKFDHRFGKYIINLKPERIGIYNIRALDQNESKILWQEFLEFAHLAKKLNDSNKLIISTLIQHNIRAYAALNCAAGKISVYNRKGQTCV